MKTKAEKLLVVNLFKRYRGNWATFSKVAHMHNPGQASEEAQIAAAPGELATVDAKKLQVPSKKMNIGTEVAVRMFKRVCAGTGLLT